MIAALVCAFTAVNAQPKQADNSQTKEAVIKLSRDKWDWMSEKNVTELRKLFHENAVFVHMGGFWGTQQELGIIEGGMIHYKKADIEIAEEVRLADNTAIVNCAMTLTAMVAGQEVITPFYVTEVYLAQPDGSWKLSVLSFTSRPQMPAAPAGGQRLGGPRPGQMPGGPGPR